MLTSITKYLFSSQRGRENSSENELDDKRLDGKCNQDGWVLVEKPSEYYGDYEDNAEDDDNDRGYSPIRSSSLIHEIPEVCQQDDFLVPSPPKKTNGHLSRSRRPSGGSLRTSTARSGDEFNPREHFSSDECQQQHSDFERYRGPYWNILEDEEKEMKTEGGVLSSASSQPEIVNIPSHEEHWILSPAPCFGGKPEECLKGSMEDLLIERPTTSIYLKFIGKESDANKPNGLGKPGTNTMGINSQARRVTENNVTASIYFQNLSDKNGFESFDSRLVTFDSIYPKKNLRSRLEQKDTDGWSSESSTRDHSLNRPTVRPLSTRHKHNFQPAMADESSEMSGGMQQVGHDPYDDLCNAKFLLPFEEDEMRIKSKRKLLPKHQRSHTRTRLWQKPRKAPAVVLMGGCK